VKRKDEHVMKTTAVIVEFLISGILFLLALLFLAMSLFPGMLSLDFLKTNKLDSWMFIIIPVLLSVAYGFGILAELIALNIFESKHKKIRGKRLDDFIDSNKKLLLKSPIDFNTINKKTCNNEKAKLMGLMRFYVLHKDPVLYHEIELQHFRLRLVRVLFLCMLILIFAVVCKYIEKRTCEWLLIEMFIIMITYLNYKGILYRFNRFNESIERTYKVLLL
jgi:hypothetical protein